MSEAIKSKTETELLRQIRHRAAEAVGWLEELFGDNVSVAQLLPGKMLRSRLAVRLRCEGAGEPAETDFMDLCASVELVHTASLCHDDVIDNAAVRRFAKTLWRRTGTSAAVLIGDLLLAEAMNLVLRAADGRFACDFVRKVREVIAAETEQELMLRGDDVDESTALRIARGKTGPLFAFAACISSVPDSDAANALETAGYKIGAAYQVADDLLDVAGSEHSAGKTTGSDQARGKRTLPQLASTGRDDCRRHIRRLLQEAVDELDTWPDVKNALVDYINNDFIPVIKRYDGELDIDLR